MGRRRELIRTIEVPTPFPVGPTNVHVLTREPITLVDVGPLTDDAWEALGAGLRTLGLAVEDVERVLLTHGHHDHYGLAARVADVSGARLYGGRLDRFQFEMERNTKGLLDRLARAEFGLRERFVIVAAVTAVDRLAEPLAAWDELSGGEVLEGDGYAVAVHAAPGHTPGSLTFEVAEVGVLFTGDTVLEGITPNAVVCEDPERPGEAFRSVSRYFETLDGIAASGRGAFRENGARRLLTGHGSAIADFRAHRSDLERRHERRVAGLLRELASGPKTVRALVAALFPRVATINLFLAFSEVLGFLMYLEDLGKVEAVAEARRDLYRLTPHGSG